MRPRRRLRRIELWLALIALAFGGLGFRLARIMLVEHGRWARVARGYHTREWQLPALRGDIYDRNGRALALSLPLDSVFADPALIPRPEAVARQLAPALQLPAEEIERALRVKGQFAWVRRHVPEEMARRVEAMGLRGIGLKPDPQRAYPQGALAGQLLGFVGAEGHGLAGVEETLDHTLAGHPGRVLVEIDAKGAVIPGRREILEPSVPGERVTLTIDANIQQLAEAELARAVEAASASGGTAIVMDPHTGEILALATQPSFDPNDFRKAPPERWVNPAIVNAYEPGSTFKLVATVAAVEEHLLQPGEVVRCAGSLAIGNRVIHCVLHGGNRAHGAVTLEKIVEKSCNIGAATLALRLGPQRMYDYARRLGFGRRTGLELSAESAGLLSDPNTWPDIRLANIGFGQGVSVTPIQLLTAYCTVAAGGVRPRPHLVRSRGGDDDHPREDKQVAGRLVIRPETARQVREMLEQAVETGTGKAARVAGYRVAGKTGTAQKAVPGAGYAGGRYIGSFLGFVPADDPKFAVLVLIDEPRGDHYGGVVAAPAFREICRQSLAYLGVPPTGTRLAQRPH